MRREPATEPRPKLSEKESKKQAQTRKQQTPDTQTPDERTLDSQELVAVEVPKAQHEAWFELLRVHASVVEGIESRLSQAKQIPLRWYDVLLALEKAPGCRLRMSELAESILTSRSNLSHLVKRLEGEGLLRREPCPDDGRGSYVVLTEAGAEARVAGWPPVAQGIVALFASKISEEEAQIMAAILRRVMDE